MKNNIKGITLIALIITIILLLILAVVTIGSIKNSNIITYAQNASKDYNSEKNKEESTLSGAEIFIESKLPGAEDASWRDNGDGTFTKGSTTVAIGDYVDYSYDTAEDYLVSKIYSGHGNDKIIAQTEGMRWRVLGIDDSGKIELISEKPTSGIAVYLSDAAGYNNGVYLLNDICKLHYSNRSRGITARSLKIEDLEKQYSETGISKRNQYKKEGYNIQYGYTKSYEIGQNMYPILYKEEIKSGVTGTIREEGIEKSDSYYKDKDNLLRAYDESGNAIADSKATANGSLLVTQTYYNWGNTPSTYFKDKIFHSMIFETNSHYWVASRHVSCSSSGAKFGVADITKANLGGNGFFWSDGSTDYDGNYLRPIVTLPNEVYVVTNENQNSITNMWTLV